MKRRWWILKIVTVGLLMAVLVGLVTMELWNWLIPVLFAGPVITFWQALGLLVLTKILFWSIGKRGGCGSHHRGLWRPYWKEKWSAMSPEDRDRFKQKMKEKWCYHTSDAQHEKSVDPEGGV